jgi:hypothetical protein
MNIIQKYMCCINNDGHNEMEKVTKEISVSIQNVSTIEVATMTRTTPTNVTTKDDTINVDNNKTEEEDDFNVVTNEDYGDIQPEDSNKTPKNNNKIIFASSSSIHEYFSNN